MRSPEIRERFLRFFEDRGHHLLPSASLIPHDDPSLLFTVAGMVPLKPYISGEKVSPTPRLASCQKCFRGSGLATDDIASVGDSTHHTFFEMLGNWSIGDYFKEGAIEFAWELLTREWDLDPGRLWPSIYPDDHEAERLWTGRIGVPKDRICRFTDNWWQAGPTGPCGYDSEIYWDWGSPCSCGRADCRPDDECGGNRWLEIWNLVFMEFDQAEDGARTLLPKRTVDTGMSLERITSVIQNVRSNYDTDIFTPIVAGFERRSAGTTETPDRRRALNILADHARAAVFLLSDGVVPGNEGRGYVLRRVIRRAALHGRRVGLQGGLADAVDDVAGSVEKVYPEVGEHAGMVQQTLRHEEESFARTLDAGSARLEALLDRGTTVIPGGDAFRLYDTFGFPIELTMEMAAQRGATVDRSEFNVALAAQRASSKAVGVRVGFESGPVLPTTTFVGYEDLRGAATVSRIGVEPERDRLVVGEEDVVLLDISPFYAEGGGQVGDRGEICWEGGHAAVLDTVHQGEARLHRVRVTAGELLSGASVEALVDAARRAQTARHHSATHFLHRALREVLGDGIVQRGSYVGPDHATFDFSFTRPLTAREMRDIEGRINAAIRRNFERSVDLMALSDARASGAIALLDESYAEKVRVVDFGGWTRELCGGTHVHRSGDVGAAIILSESSVGQGIRRIDMVTGEAAELHWAENERTLRETARALKSRPEEVAVRVQQLLDQNRDLRRRQQSGGGTEVVAALAAAEVHEVAGYRVALVDRFSLDTNEVSATIDRLFAEHVAGRGVAVILGENVIAVKVGPDARAAGVNAGDLVRSAAEASGGRGGGRPEFARGSLKDAARRGEARQVLSSSLGEAVHR
ncbi:MAG: alanine--tRNA ligase [Candidatus Dormibacteria bacterium]